MSKHRTNRGRLALSLAVTLSLTKGVGATAMELSSRPTTVWEDRGQPDLTLSGFMHRGSFIEGHSAENLPGRDLDLRSALATKKGKYGKVIVTLNKGNMVDIQADQVGEEQADDPDELADEERAEGAVMMQTIRADERADFDFQADRSGG